MSLRFLRVLPAVAALALALPLDAQGPEGGRIVGKVVDRDGGLPLGGARITVVGTSLTTSTKVDAALPWRTFRPAP